jgi:Cellulose binding domain
MSRSGSRPPRMHGPFERPPKHAKTTQTWGTVVAVALCAGVLATTFVAAVTQGLDLADLLPGGSDDDATVHAAGSRGPFDVVTMTSSPQPITPSATQTPQPPSTSPTPDQATTPSAPTGTRSTPTHTPTLIPEPPPPPALACETDAQVIDWRAGSLFVGTVVNTGTAEASDWALTLTLSREVDVHERRGWRSDITQDGRQVTVRPEGDDDRTLDVGEAFEFGFTVEHRDSDDAPAIEGIVLNGTACG